MHKARAAAKTAKAMEAQVDEIVALHAKVDYLTGLVKQLLEANNVKPARKAAKGADNDDQ